MELSTRDGETLAMDATTTVGDLAHGDLPLLSLELAATGTVAGGAPLGPIAALFAADSPATTETTYVVNLTTGAITQWRIGACDKLVMAHGALYGLRADGVLVRMGGADDAGAAIPATLRFAPQTFGVNQAKRLGEVYLSLRAAQGITLTLIADETTAWSYPASPPAPSPALRPHKVKVGKGVVFHSLGLVVTNLDGGDFTLGGMELPLQLLARRVP